MHALLRPTALLLALAACQPGGSTPGGSPPEDDASPAASAGDTAGPVELRVDQSSYPPGGEVALTLVNHAAGAFGFNPCTRTVERRTEDGEWTVFEEPGRICTMELWILAEGATRSATTTLPDTLEAGRYRLVVTLTREGQTPPPAESVRAESAPFAVEP